MSKRCVTTRLRHKGEWISLYVEDIGFAYSVGLTIHKSRRAANDWYWNRKNKRCRSVLNKQKTRPFGTLLRAMRMLEAHIQTTRDKPYFIMPRTDKTAALAKYLKRIGFTELQSDGQLLYLLVTHQEEEA